MSPSTNNAARARCRVTRRRLAHAALGLLLCFLAPAVAAQEALETVVIETADARHIFRVPLADEPEELRRGLMFRYSIPPDGGMLFDFGGERPATMWMRNTYIPLDMLFIRADGSIARIVHQARPRSTTVHDSGEPVRGVLEVRGGTAERLGIQAGDVVRHSLFGNAEGGAGG